MARSRRVDVAVIGGGIVGTATAAFLAEAGLSVRLSERTSIAAGASGRNSGIVQHPFDAVLADLYQRSLAAYRELSEGEDATFRLPAEPSGLLYVGRNPGLAEAEAARWRETWPAARAEVVAGADLLRLEPRLAPDLTVCRLAIGYPVEPAAATRAFAARATAAGVEVEVGDAVSVAIDRGRAVGVVRDGRTEPAGRVVVAAGPSTPVLVDPSGGWRPIRPSWGVVASIALDAAPRHGLESIDIDIEPDADGPEPRDGPADLVDFSLVPAAGSSALGSTFLADEPVPDEWVERLRGLGARYVPGIADAPVIGLRACARPVSLDGRPLIGEAPWCDGLWVAAGNGPWGISTGPGTARLLVDRMLGIAGDPIPEALATARFGAPGRRPYAGRVIPTGLRVGVRSSTAPLRDVLVKRPGPAFGAAFDDPTHGFRWPCDLAAAQREHDGLVAALDGLGVRVHHLDVEPASDPDLCYVFDPLLVVTDGAIPLRPGKPNRTGEPALLADWLMERGTPIVGRIEAPGTVEGGDTVWLRDDLFVIGRTLRTNDAGARQLAALVGGDTRIVDVPYWNGPAELVHLMSVISPVSDDLAVAFLPLLPAGLWSWLHELGIGLVEVPADEYPTLGCNVLAVRPGVVIVADGNPVTRRRLEAAGVEVHAIPLREVGENGSGGVTCLTRPLLREA